jgi:hypothetical protein
MSPVDMKRVCASVAAVAGCLGGAGAASAQVPGSAAVDQAKVEWRALTHRSHLDAAVRINTSDGRQFTGSQLNYVWVLLDRAQGTCDDPEPSKAMAYLHEARGLLYPPPRQL